MHKQVISLKQTFQQFERALSLLQNGLQSNDLSPVERGGVVHFFEVCCELSWSILKKYADTEGAISCGPKEAVEFAIRLDLVKDAEGWMSLLQDQWMLSEIYDEEIARTVEENIRMKYFPLLTQLRHEFSAMMKEKEA